MAKNELVSKLQSPAIKAKIEEVIGAKANGFTASLLSVVTNNKLLANADFNSIYTSAMKAATLDLPIEPSLGFAYIVPYKNEAQFQIGYKGLIQLALRSGKVVGLNAGEVYEEQFISFDPLFEKLEVDFTQKVKSDKPVGYFATLELSNGFKKLIYRTREDIEKHGKKYSKSFSKGFSPWQSDFDAMAKKTVIKSMLSTYAPLSIEMQQAIVADNQDSTVSDFELKDVTETTESSNLIEDVMNGAEVPENVDVETGEINQPDLTEEHQESLDEALQETMR